VTPQDCAVIFDVDGVLLELTATEEDVFFGAFQPWCAPSTLSRDWNSYRIRNDDNIVDEIMARLGLPPQLKTRIVADYHARIGALLANGSLLSHAIPGAADLLATLDGKTRLGIATANFREAARLRLLAAGLWQGVSGLAQGADGGGHKHEILARALHSLKLPRSRIVYVGDNVNDLEAGLRNGVHFIGFSTQQERLEHLAAAGATYLSGHHAATRILIENLLNA